MLNGLDFTLAPQGVVALVGPSGAGKSTVIDLLCGFYQPQAGVISLFGQDIRTLEPTALRQQISLVCTGSLFIPGNNSREYWVRTGRGLSG